MNSGVSELKARQLVQKLRSIRGQVDVLGSHAQFLSRSFDNFDGLTLLNEATATMAAIMQSVGDFRDLDAEMTSVTRSLRSHQSSSAKEGTMSVATKWSNEFRALSKQLAVSVQNTDKELTNLRKAAGLKVGDPLRTAGTVDGPSDVLQGLASLLSVWIVYLRRPAK